jgi:hypothetical protein
MAKKKPLGAIFETRDVQAFTNYIFKRSEQVEGNQDTECWVWTGAMMKDKYPILMYWTGSKRRRLSVRGAIQEIINGEETKQGISAVCDNPKCVNPDHLEYAALFSAELRRAMKGKDVVELTNFLRGFTDETPSVKFEESACWVSDAVVVGSSGYIQVTIEGVKAYAHRVIAEFISGEPLNGAPVHHKCANRSCLNPDHYQITTHCQNTAEMLARKYYESRISEAEKLLSAILPKLPEGTYRGAVEAFLLAA